MLPVGSTGFRSGAIKVGYLVSQYPALTHTFVLREVRALRQRGFDICVVSVRSCDRSQSELNEDEADEARQTFSVLGAGYLHALLANLRMLGRHPRGYLRGLLYAWALSRGTPKLLLLYTFYFLEATIAGDYFEQHRVRHIHTHFSSTVLLILARILRIRYSITVHGPDDFIDVVGFHLEAKVAGASFVATVSQWSMSQVLGACDAAYWHKVLVLPLGVDTEKFSPENARARQPGEPFKLLSVGRLSPAKGYPILIEAMALLNECGRNVTLTLVGEGPLRGVLQALIAAKGLGEIIRFAGPCNHEQVVQFYRSSDAFVLSSFREGIPVVLMEAMSMELPCVATWINGIPELIENRVEGSLVPPANPSALADAVGHLMDDPQGARALGIAARHKVVARFHLERNVERLAQEFSVRLAK